MRVPEATDGVKDRRALASGRLAQVRLRGAGDGRRRAETTSGLPPRLRFNNILTQIRLPCGVPRSKVDDVGADLAQRFGCVERPTPWLCPDTTMRRRSFVTSIVAPARLSGGRGRGSRAVEKILWGSSVSARADDWQRHRLLARS